MRASMAYFAGAGTVVAAIVGGVGGGLLIADMISPKSPKQGTEMTRLERRMAPDPIPAAAVTSEPAQSPAASQLSVSAPPQPAPAPGATAAAASAPVQQAGPVNSASTSQPAPVEASAVQPAAQGAPPAAQAAQPASVQTAASPVQPAAPPVQSAVTREQTVTPVEDTFAKARRAEVERSVEKRKAMRRQQWTERRRYQPQQEVDLRAVEAKVREETEPRRDFAEPLRVEMPVIRLFGSD
jgi:hypothetical protein